MYWWDWFTHNWSGIFGGSHGGSNKTPWPSTGKSTSWSMRTTFFFPLNRISGIHDSLDNANTCRDAVSVVKQVSAFAVSNHKRHSVRLANQQGSSRKGSAVCQVSQANPSKCDITWTEASLEYGDVIWEWCAHDIPCTKKKESNVPLLFDFDCCIQDRTVE
jgi:hypothetical protein